MTDKYLQTVTDNSHCLFTPHIHTPEIAEEENEEEDDEDDVADDEGE